MNQKHCQQTKSEAIETDLSALKVCYELTPEMLKTEHFCEKCLFQLGGTDPLVKGKVDEIEERIDKLTAEWTDTLLNTISDPFVLGQKSMAQSLSTSSPRSELVRPLSNGVYEPYRCCELAGAAHTRNP
ncbi:MAG: DUF6079 family protein [Clostridiales Family XIII bacterium]|jgi:hypothetical protein|nr:DUF6079 family protein [Clostridiales Family XIII bacterium]